MTLADGTHRYYVRSSKSELFVTFVCQSDATVFTLSLSEGTTDRGLTDFM